MLEFDQETHTYAEDGRVLPSVTQVLRAVGISPDYGSVPEEILRKKAERGSFVHREIEDFVRNGTIGFTPEFGEFVKEFGNGCSEPESEVMVSDGRIAGTADLIFERDGKPTIADFKTTATLHRDSVAWQLSLYAYLSGREIERGEAWHFSPSGLRVYEVILKTKEECENLIQAYLKGEKFNAPAPVEENKLIELEEAEKAIADLKKRIAEYEASKAEIMDAIKAAMEATGTKTYEGDRIRITYVAPVEKKTVDSKRLKEERPDIYEQYTKTTLQGASVRITIKGEKHE